MLNPLRRPHSGGGKPLPPDTAVVSMMLAVLQAHPRLLAIATTAFSEPPINRTHQPFHRTVVEEVRLRLLPPYSQCKNGRGTATVPTRTYLLFCLVRTGHPPRCVDGQLCRLQHVVQHLHRPTCGESHGGRRNRRRSRRTSAGHVVSHVPQ